MPYVIDRARALWLDRVVAIVPGARRQHRSRVIMRDNGLYHTLTRPRTLAKNAQAYPETIQQAGGLSRRFRAARERAQGARWRKPPPA